MKRVRECKHELVTVLIKNKYSIPNEAPYEVKYNQPEHQDIKVFCSECKKTLDLSIDLL